jgi:hypothetical protein
MFALTSSMVYFLYPGSVDMRKGIYSLYLLVKSEMRRNPLSGEVYLFFGRTRSTVKILHWEKDGFVLYVKKLERGTFRQAQCTAFEMPCYNPGSGSYEMKWSTFVLIMEGVSVGSARYRKRFALPQALQASQASQTF